MRIGIFDSGIGGLTVLHRAIRRCPGAEYLYYADCAHVPYGERTAEEICAFVREIVEFLLGEGAQAIVIACNTATSVAVRELRQTFSVPIIGMEPAVKLALDRCAQGRILAAATPVTVRGDKLHSLLEKWDEHRRADLLALPELVRFAERGEFEGETVTAYLRDALSAFRLEDYSAFVLGCTHFNFFKDTFRALLPERVRLLDGADGVVSRLMSCVEIPAEPSGVPVRFFDSGACVESARLAQLEACMRRLDLMERIE